MVFLEATLLTFHMSGYETTNLREMSISVLCPYSAESKLAASWTCFSWAALKTMFQFCYALFDGVNAFNGGFYMLPFGPQFQWGVRDKSGGYGVREAQKSSNRPERMQQRRAMMAFAPHTDQRIPDCLRRSPMTVRQPALTTPEPTKNFFSRYSA